MSTPWTIEVDGVVLPKPLSGDPALELCNTRAGWDGPPDPRGEYLRSYDALALLAVTSGVLSAEAGDALRQHAVQDPGTADRVLARARSLRADLYAALTGSPSAAARKRLADAISAAHSRQRFVVDVDSARWEFSGHGTLKDPLDALLIEAGRLLADEQRELVAACPGEDCGWLFLNTSGRRRWCQMAVCGNRAKQASFVNRQRG
ncbi:MAG TPA: CGNR zinc finger domain-containing protein [Flexivirga sp.]|uniref:CGNR zinc finger domain-containing protein n=1 Tax=Flexivirga sp. TaxID=1962927 RepID=UPI002B58037F|nr:CGNR zinc finger domain-containing protein [Flexivirga sp.]HWC24866.1 CGNR zinc finger domain-containing protein [Flexivirga sp.]